MGKRSNFKRRPQDRYSTPMSAVLPLLPHLDRATKFVEPCAGYGVLMMNLIEHGHDCIFACDISPKGTRRFIRKRDALTLTREYLVHANMGNVRRFQFITNLPWAAELKHALIEHLMKIAPTWVLLDADWMHTQMAAQYLDHCDKIVSVGRVRWIRHSKHVSLDNAAWFHFNRRHHGGPRFVGRAA